MGVEEADSADCDKVVVSSGSAQFALEILTKELHFTLCLLASDNKIVTMWHVISINMAF